MHARIHSGILQDDKTDILAISLCRSCIALMNFASFADYQQPSLSFSVFGISF